MTEVKYIFISFSLTLLLSLAAASPNINQKWSVGNHFGYDGGFCLPGLCIRGAGGSRVQFGGGGRIPYNGGNMNRIGYRETMYCKPLTCWSGSCGALHLHLDKSLYESLVSKKKAAEDSSSVDFIPETLEHNVNSNYDDFKKVKEAAMAPTSHN